MKLKQYLINEGTIELTNSEIREGISKDCKPFMKLTKGKPFYKGMYKGLFDQGKIDVRQDRRPSGTDSLVFPELNKWLKKNGHLTRNNTLICSPSRKNAQDFGRLFEVYPIGNVKYTWFWSKDVNLMDRATGYDDYMLDLFFKDFKKYSEIQYSTASLLNIKNKNAFDVTDDEIEKAYKISKNWFDKYGFVSNKNIDVAIRHGFEVWFDCKSYYTIMVE